MNLTYLEAARERINNIPMLINVVSRRVRQLNHGQRPMVKADEPGMSKLDVAMKEVAEGKLAAEISAKPTRATTSDNLITL
jgi:DNA-directed RNA polymerase subunit omega